MKNTGIKFIKLIVVLLMLAGAALSVNKEILGHKPSAEEGKTTSATLPDSIVRQPDGSVIIHTCGLSGTKSGYAGSVPVDIRITEGKIAEFTLYRKEWLNFHPCSIFLPASFLWPASA